MYDVFITYSHVDRAWAAALEQSLTKLNIEVFLDDKRLTAGDLWEQSLAKAVRASRNLVFLRSDAAQASNWVSREVGLFEGIMLDDPNRRLIAVNLEGEDKSRASLQQINLVRDADVYTKGVTSASDILSKVVAEIESAVRIKDDRVPVAVAVLTVRSNDLTALTNDQFNEIQKEFQLDANAVKDRYGPSRLDWRPFGQQDTIARILDDLVNPLSHPDGRRFRWEPAADGIWDSATIDDAIVPLVNASLSLVVVDTLMLEHPKVFQKMMQLRDYLKRSITSWLLFPPLASDPAALAYREAVKRRSSPLLREYFEPPLPPDVMAPLFGVHCGDATELRRMVRLTAGMYIARAQGGPKVSFTQYQ